MGAALRIQGFPGRQQAAASKKENTMAEYKFEAKIRPVDGKKGARGLRGQDKLPAIVYGRGEKSLAVEVSAKELPLIFLRTIGKNALLTMSLTDEAGKTSDTTVMFKEVQREPVKGKFQHIDFYHVDMKHPLKLKVPVVLTGTAHGVKEKGGLLSQPTRNLTVRCLPSDIPAQISIDISALDLEETVLLQSVTPPKGVTFLGDPHTVLAMVSTIEEEKAPEPAAAAADAAKGPEVITAKKPEEGAAAAPAAGGKDAKAAAPAAKAPAKK
jgi:large subunit ribosomal protein L25